MFLEYAEMLLLLYLERLPTGTEIDVPPVETILQAKHHPADYNIDIPQCHINVTFLWGNLVDLSRGPDSQDNVLSLNSVFTEYSCKPWIPQTQRL